MHIENLAIWCNDLEKMKTFYCTYFNGKANAKYINPFKNFSSYFISFLKRLKARTDADAQYTRQRK